MKLHVNETGINNQASILLIHGGCVSGWIWAKHTRNLSEFHCIIPDLPLHGSSAGFEPFSIKESARYMETLIRTKAHGGKAHVIGLSLGAQIAVELLGMAPEIVQSCIVSGSLLCPIKGQLFLIGLTKVCMPFKESHFLLKTGMNAMNIPEEYFSCFQRDIINLKKPHLIQLMKETLSYSLPSELDHVNVPTLVLVGQHQSGIIYRCARELEYILPRGIAYVVSNSNHNWMISETDLFSRLVRAWTNNEMLPDEVNPIF
jgi:pimeloyl-ACP methyl ester carboxylesterase